MMRSRENYYLSDTKRRIYMQVNIRDLKAIVSRDDVVGILNSVGYTVETRTFKFCLREERTPSAVVNKDCSIHDYGSGYHGDILDLLTKYNGMSLSDAIRLVSDYVGFSSNSGYSYTPRPKQKSIQYHKQELSNETRRKLERTVRHFEADNDLCTFANDDYKKEMLAIAPLFVFMRTTRDAIKRFRNATLYDAQNKTLVIKIHDYKGNIISYKRRRLNGKKWITAKGTHPNKQCLISITDEDKSIFVVEGHHDYLTAILLGLNVLMIPTVSYKRFNSHEIELLEGKAIVFLPDWKNNDLSGVDTMEELGRQLDEIAYSVRIFSFPKFLKDEGVEFESDKLDLSEVVEIWGKERIPLKPVLEHLTRDEV